MYPQKILEFSDAWLGFDQGFEAGELDVRNFQQS